MAVQANFYVYEWVRPDIGMVFYVGKGKSNRAYSSRRNKHTNDVVAFLSKNNLKHEVRILAYFVNEQSAFDFEIERIAFWEPLGELTNKTPGGDCGPVMVGSENPFYGREHSEESRAKMSAKLKGKIPAIAGKKHSDESKEKMSAAKLGKPGVKSMLGRKHSEETKAKMSAARLGKPSNSKGWKMSDEQRQALSERSKKMWMNPEHRQKAIRTEISEETRAKLSRSATAQWADPEKRPNRGKGA